ncbi:hypothetical protein G7046_g7101 [Stylonectria norvegica]|nr:hypothetical protein G7046_g7101 [Stylonectria norvegica]
MSDRRYTADFLLHLRQSPLCTKPTSLPPAEEWMGAPPEQIRAQTKTAADRPRTNDNPLLDQTNRRPALERHVSRNSANPEDIVFAPPRMAFASSRGNKSLENDKGIKEAIDLPSRFGNFRSRNGESDGDRFREGRNAPTTAPLRRRDGDGQETEGWSTVKPRKSFGPEGAERFHGRMGGNFRDERRQPKERDDREAPRDRPTRTFDTFTREKEPEDADSRARNGTARNKSEPWYKNEPNESLAPEKRERIDRAKSWRDRDREAEPPVEDRNSGRTHERRWGREQRVEREPEWLDEPLEEQPEAHTQQDFQKWMEDMKKAKNGTPSAPSKPAVEVAVEAEKPPPPVQSAPAVESGPDKFFMAFGNNSGLDGTTPGAESNDGTAKAKPAGKSSRFTSFFNHAQEDVRGKTEPATPIAGPPPSNPLPFPLVGGAGQPPAPEEERQAFKQLLAKLQKQTMSATPPGPSPFAAPPHGTPDNGKKSAITSPEPPFQQYGGDRRVEMPMGRRPPPQHVQEILAPRPQQQLARPDQLLQDLVGQHQRATSQGSGRPDPARNNSNTEFLMNLMRAPQDPQRNEQLLMRMPQPHKQQAQMPPMHERELDYSRDNRGPQRQQQQQMRPQPPPGFPGMDDSCLLLSSAAP